MSRATLRTPPRQERSRFTVAAILEAAERLIASGAGAGTRGVAKLAGVSVGTLYQYFPAKEAIFASVIARRLHDDEVTLMGALEQLGTQPLHAAVRRLVDHALPEQRWEIALYPYLVDGLETAGLQAELHALLTRVEDRWRQELERRSHELRADLAPGLAATVSLHAMRATMLALARQSPQLSRDEIAAEICAVGMRYLTGDTG